MSTLESLKGTKFIKSPVQKIEREVLVKISPLKTRSAYYKTLTREKVGMRDKTMLVSEGLLRSEY